MKKIADWLKTKNRSVETLHCADDSYQVLIHDSTGASADGYGKSPDDAFEAALGRYKAAQHRAKLTTERYTVKQITGRTTT
jgi:hypothetical protein